jgi:nitrogen-specific signal transduction histidine kinase
LWITRGIVEKHRGSIRMKSRAGQNNHGTAFSIFLPAEYTTAVPASSATAKRNTLTSAGGSV